MIESKYMRNIFVKILVCCLALLCVSCFKEVDLGYPAKITFSKAGGEKVVNGKRSFTHAAIQDYKGNEGETIIAADGKRYNVYDWLWVENEELYYEELKVYAAPNTTGKRRTLYIELYSGPEYQVVTVKQGK